MNSDLLLDIARRELDELKSIPGPLLVGTDSSAHLRHALTTTVFSAFAVEHAIVELIWVRCLFQFPHPYRSLARLYASGARTIPEKIKLLRAVTNLEPDLLGDIEKLFKDRNRVGHATGEAQDDYALDFDSLKAINESGRGENLDRALKDLMGGKDDAFVSLARDFGTPHLSVAFGGFGSSDITDAEDNFRIAERAIEALASERESPEWPVQPPSPRA